MKLADPKEGKGWDETMLDWAAAHYELGLLYLETGAAERAAEEQAKLAGLNSMLAEQLLLKMQK